MKHDVVALLWCDLALMDLRLKLLPHSLNRDLLKPDSPDKEAKIHAKRQDEIMKLAHLVETAAKYSLCFNMSCLRQALVIRARLKAKGIKASLVYGVRKGASGFSAHAWIEVGGLSINGAPDTVFWQFDNPENRR